MFSLPGSRASRRGQAVRWVANSLWLLLTNATSHSLLLFAFKLQPKRPLSAYNIFFQIERKKLIEAREKGETPDDFDMASVSSNSDGDEQEKKKKASLFQAIAQTIANRWKALPGDERVKFEELAKEEMRKYRIKKDEYQQRMVRETLDVSTGRASSGVGSSPRTASSHPPPVVMAGGQTSAASLAHQGFLGPHAGAGYGLPISQPPAVSLLGIPQQSQLLQEYLQRQQGALAGLDPFRGLGLPSQDLRLQALQLQSQGLGIDRLLALRALQNDSTLHRLDPALLPQTGRQLDMGGYLGIPGGLDPRVLESIRLQEAAAGLGGLGGVAAGSPAPTNLSNLELLRRAAAQPQFQLSDLPPEQLLSYLNARQQGGLPPGGAPDYGPKQG